MLRVKYPSAADPREFRTAEVSIPGTSHSQADVSSLPISKVRRLVEEQVNVSLSSLELIYAGRKLNKLDKLLSDYGVKPNTRPILHLLPIPKSRVASDSHSNKSQTESQLLKLAADFPLLHQALQDQLFLSQLKEVASTMSVQYFDIMSALLPPDTPQFNSAQFLERLQQPETLPDYLKDLPDLAGFLNSLLKQDDDGRFSLELGNLGGIPEALNLAEADDGQMDIDPEPQTPGLIIPPIPVLSAPPASPAVPLISAEMLSQALAQSAQGPPQVGPSLSPAMAQSLQTLKDMGFPDEQSCLRALQTSNGDIEAAVNIMLTPDLF